MMPIIRYSYESYDAQTSSSWPRWLIARPCIAFVFFLTYSYSRVERVLLPDGLQMLHTSPPCVASLYYLVTISGAQQHPPGSIAGS